MPLTDTRELKRLAELRRELEKTERSELDAILAVGSTPEGKAEEKVLAQLAFIRQDIKAVEATIRGTALEHYDETGEKEPWPGVKIKLYTVVRYDPKTALAWAKENSPNLLALNKRAFERAAKSGLTGPMGAVGKEPRAQIVRDLSEYLPTVAEAMQEGEDTEQ